VATPIRRTRFVWDAASAGTSLTGQSAKGYNGLVENSEMISVCHGVCISSRSNESVLSKVS
jgi:hypothetical protein